MGFRETGLLREAVEQLRVFLPPSWTIKLIEQLSSADHDHLDGLLELRPPRGDKITFAVEVKLSTQRFHPEVFMAKYLNMPKGLPSLLVTDYANPAIRRFYEEAGTSYLDLTGWVYLRDDNAGLFVRSQGALRAPAAPTKQGTAMRRLDGPGASQVVRTLWDIPLPVGVRELASVAGVSPGTAAKVLPTLASYGAIVRTASGAVEQVDRRLLIERWIQDYGIYTTNPEVSWHLAPRGPGYAYVDLMRLSLDSDVMGPGISLTGYSGTTLALPKKTYPVIPDTLMAVYCADPSFLAFHLKLRTATPTTGNVVLIRPKDESLLRPGPGTSPAPLPQVMADLLTMGGRFPELAEQIFDISATQTADI